MKKVSFVLALALPLLMGMSIAADFNGDGMGDIAVFRPSSGLWSVRGITRVYFGKLGDIPVPANYTGLGKNSVAIFRNTNGLWAIRDLTRIYFGGGSDEPKPGDYNGDGTEDIAIFRASAGLWAARDITRLYFGTSGDKALAPTGTIRRMLSVTGQTISRYQGDDGYYQSGAAFSFHTEVISGNTVTIDHNTGLTWAADGNEAGCNFNSYTDLSSAFNWAEDLEFAGQTDWRIPNIKELISIIDYEGASVVVDPDYFPNTTLSYYWCSTTVQIPPGFGICVNFDNGISDIVPSTSTYKVRAVRGGL